MENNQEPEQIQAFFTNSLRVEARNGHQIVLHYIGPSGHRHEHVFASCPTDYSQGLDMVALELRSQRERWGRSHDSQHTSEELLRAAHCYARVALWGWSQATGRPNHEQILLGQWPFEQSSWRPSRDALRNLQKAGALICAEMDRLIWEASMTPRETFEDRCRSGSPHEVEEHPDWVDPNRPVIQTIDPWAGHPEYVERLKAQQEALRDWNVNPRDLEGKPPDPPE